MNSKRVGFFFGMPTREGVEKIGYLILFPLGIFLCFIKVGIVNGFGIGIPVFNVLESNELWISIVKCWNNNSPVFRGMASEFIKVDLIGAVISSFISVASIKGDSLRIWGNALNLQVLVLASCVFSVVILSDCLALIGCGDVEKDNVNFLSYFVQNTTIGLLIKTFVVIASGYYLPSSVRMLFRKIVMEFK